MDVSNGGSPGFWPALILKNQMKSWERVHIGIVSLRGGGRRTPGFARFRDCEGWKQNL
jgi:hypothetical protein